MKKFLSAILLVSLACQGCSWSPRLRSELMDPVNNRGYDNLARVTSVGYKLLHHLPATDAFVVDHDKAHLPFIWSAVSDAYDGLYGSGYNFGREPIFVNAIEGYEPFAQGLARGDYMVEFNGRKVSSASAVYKALNEIEGQNSVKIKFKQGEAISQYEVPVLYLALDLYFAVQSKIEAPYSDYLKKRNVVAISQNLVDFTESDDELAYILAHDIAHRMYGHERPEGYSSEQFMTDLFLYGLVVATAFPLHESGSYSKEEEAEAHEAALTFIKAAGYNPELGVNVIERLRKSRDVKDNPWFFIHPVMKDLAEQYKARLGTGKGIIHGGQELKGVSPEEEMLAVIETTNQLRGK